MKQYQWSLAFKMPLKAFVIIVALSVIKKTFVPCEFGIFIAQTIPKQAEFQYLHVFCKAKQNINCIRKLLVLLLVLSRSLNAAIIKQSFFCCCWGGCYSQC